MSIVANVMPRVSRLEFWWFEMANPQPFVSNRAVHISRVNESYANERGPLHTLRVLW